MGVEVALERGLYEALSGDYDGARGSLAEDGGGDPEWSGERRGGSANLDMLANAIALYVYPEQHLKLYSDAWVSFFENNKHQWMRSELLSMVYTGWQVLSVLAVYRWAVRAGNSALEALCREWLEQFWGICALMSTTIRGGRDYVAICGQRSSGYPLDAWWAHHFLWSEALRGSWPGRSNPEDPSTKMVKMLSDEISSTSRKARIAYSTAVADGDWRDAYAAIPKIGVHNKTHFYRTTGGTCMWMETDTNGNTGGILALKVVDGVPSSLPLEGGPHWRQKHTHATCALEGGELVYSSPYEELGLRKTMSLPSGDLLFHIVATDAGWSWEAPVAATEPVQPTPPAPTPPAPRPPAPGKKGKKTPVGLFLFPLIGAVAAEIYKRFKKKKAADAETGRE